MDFGKVLKFGLFEWVSNKTALKFGAILAFFLIILSFIMPLIMQVFFPESIVSQEPTLESIFSIGSLFLVAFAVGIISTIIALFIQYKIISAALVQKKYKAVPLDFVRFIKFIFYSFIESLAAIFCIYELKYLAVGILSLVLFILGMIFVIFSSANFILGIIGALFLVLAVILALVYFVIVIYNSYRLMLGIIVFIASGKGIFDSLKSSWGMTKGNVLMIFLVMLVIGAIIASVSFALTLPAMFYGMAIGILDSAFGGTVATFDPIYLTLLIPAQIIAAVGVIVSSYTLVALYDELK